MTVTAAAISGILNRAGFKRAASGTHWSAGFETSTFPDHVLVTYAAVNSDQKLAKLQAMAKLINGRPSKKYWAYVEAMGKYDNHLVMRVEAYDESSPKQNEARKGTALEVLADEHPAAPAIADVKKALRRYSQYDADFCSSGYKVERLEEDTRLVRIRLVETPYTTYEGDRDTHIAKTLANYARVVFEDGFEFQVREDEMSVIVAMPGEWDNALAVETVDTVLRAHHTPCSQEGGTTGYIVSSNRSADGALRVQHYPFTDDDDKVAYATVARYAKTLAKAGYTAVEAPDDDWALLVTVAPPAKPQEPEELPTGVEETPEEVRQALLKLREAVEWDLAHTTRRAGDHSIFILSNPYGGGEVRRLEVFYSDGEYRTKGYLGRGDWFRFPEAGKDLRDFIRNELRAF